MSAVTRARMFHRLAFAMRNDTWVRRALAKLRNDEDQRRSKELSEITNHVTQLKDVAAEQLRAVAAEALAAELGRVRAKTGAFVREHIIP